MYEIFINAYIAIAVDMHTKDHKYGIEFYNKLVRTTALTLQMRHKYGLTPGLDRARPADVLVRDWAQGKPAAFDITVTSPLTPAILAEASRRVGAAAEAAENRKHTANDPKCAELGWRCVPLAVETYCNWGEEARGTFALLATRLAFGSSSFRKARVISDMFGRLNITLVRAIARAILARTVIPSDFN